SAENCAGENPSFFCQRTRRGLNSFLCLTPSFCPPKKADRDVAAIWVHPKAAEEIGRHKEFLFHNQINLAKDYRKPLYLFFGYPTQWSGRVVSESEIVSRGLAFATFEHSGERSRKIVYHPEVHMLLILERQAVNLFTGSMDMLPRPNGISG